MCGGTCTGRVNTVEQQHRYNTSHFNHTSEALQQSVRYRYVYSPL
jgi:hypothetical protein